MHGWLSAWRSGCVGLPRQILAHYISSHSTLSKRLQALCRWFQNYRCRMQQCNHQRLLLCRCSGARLDRVRREVCARRRWEWEYVVWMWLVSGCGSVQGASLTERANLACRGFFPYTLCYNSIFVCDLNDGRLDKQKNEDARNGVLCCPP